LWDHAALVLVLPFAMALTLWLVVEADDAKQQLRPPRT
jgi:hypothetical protein